MSYKNSNGPATYHMQGVGTIQAAAAGIYGDTNQIKGLSLLENQVNRVSRAAGQLEELAGRLHVLADRIFGCQDAAGASTSGGAPPSPSYSLGKLDEANEWNDRSVALLRSVVERLEAL